MFDLNELLNQQSITTRLKITVLSILETRNSQLNYPHNSHITFQKSHYRRQTQLAAETLKVPRKSATVSAHHNTEGTIKRVRQE